MLQNMHQWPTDSSM